jgi:hypothetical protein
MDFSNELSKKLAEGTLIEAGHYSYKKGPSELDSFLFQEGVKLYKLAKNNYKKIGLMILVDDVNDVSTNEERRAFDIKELPKNYLQILQKYQVDPNEVIIYSQDRIREKGRRLLRRKKESRTEVPQCRFIVATLVREKEKLGYKNAIVLSDELKTESGQKLQSGTVYSRILFKTKIPVHYFVFKDKEYYNHFLMPSGESEAFYNKRAYCNYGKKENSC